MGAPPQLGLGKIPNLLRLANDHTCSGSMWFSPHGTFTIHFGGDPKSTNYLRIMPTGVMSMRLYRPSLAVISDKWTFREATPVR